MSKYSAWNLSLPIPDLNEYGVLPSGRHPCNLAEIEQRYANNNHRLALWADFERFLTWCATRPSPAEVLVDGGFTSDKNAPKDIDIVFDLSGCDQACVGVWMQVFFAQRAQLMKDFRVDFWVYLPGANKDLRAFFEYVKPEEAILRGMPPDETKGLLRVTI